MKVKVKALVAERPHLRNREPPEGVDVGQGAGPGGGGFDVSGVMRRLAGA